MQKNHHTQHHGGFALYLAIVISGIVIFIGIAVADISFQEVRLSQSGRDSQYAFYAANTGIECALYWDAQYAAFPLSSDTAGDLRDPIYCADQEITPVVAESDENNATTTFSVMGINDAPPSCAHVTVGKASTTSGVKTIIQARGRDNCDGADRVERAIRVTY